jgi:hypothetical protein
MKPVKPSPETSPNTTGTYSSPALEPMGYGPAPVTRSLGMSRRTLERLRASGRFPAPDFWIGRSPRWKRETLVNWISKGGAR